MTRWRLFDTGAHDGAWNMACDLALMERARRTGESVFRVYAWSRPTLSFGRHELARRQYDAQALRAAGIDVVRRPTGGRALLHDHEVTYSITAPVVPGETLAESVHRFNALLLHALHALGVPAITATSPRTLRPEGAACFAVPAPGELTLGGRKLVGSAQVRREGALLQHGSILLDDDQGRIAAFATGPYLASADAASLHEALGDAATYETVCAALLRAAGGGADDGMMAELVLPMDESAFDRRVLDDALAHFRDDAWTWRR